MEKQMHQLVQVLLKYYLSALNQRNTALRSLFKNIKYKDSIFVYTEIKYVSPLSMTDL